MTHGRYPPTLRDRLPRGESYPVSRQALDAALGSARVSGTTLTLVYFLRGGQDWQGHRGQVVDVHFRAATRDRPKERTELRIYAVPTPLHRGIATALEDGGLGHVARWIADNAVAGNAWRASDHRLVASWTGRTVQLEELHGTGARAW